jgi:hypothetical protein
VIPKLVFTSKKPSSATATGALQHGRQLYTNATAAFVRGDLTRLSPDPYTFGTKTAGGGGLLDAHIAR